MPFRRSDRKCFYLAAYIRIGLRGGGVERPGKRKELWGAAAGRMGKRKVLQKVLVEHNAGRQKVSKSAQRVQSSGTVSEDGRRS